ncbi:cell division protein FtsA [Desulfotomaculum nigrificans CO-1-SRB]|uniref:Cell division protein FtsA n=1 Tax=Desulfotomaculum nigrificans (strain DSM 14880 / VKM B-2319 / CO-1-SRB) TaxID=868595 RepID=F6B9G3_DESCC|nr:cell division FtsA domain-containing protein [Desulfotomaculum nigrificans]AEF93739.1 cell division protein FtsA [Desulfotomaculum nigrificans CO-1-SRB]
MPKPVYDQNNIVFALDIGTRTVIGLVVAVKNGTFKILAQSMVEHQSRAMLDGQIHDIPRVAEAVHRVKHELEKKLKFELKRVAIAAAGRSLKTRQCRVEQELAEDVEIDSLMVHSLELMGVQQAQRLLESELYQGEKEKFFCVGHSVLAYYLNDFSITNLIGHRGQKIAADILATFLPASVVNSLYAVLGRVNLEPLSLTLEPIAACEVVIPEELRLLNLALVDVGAGTSDIAITKDGAVQAYGMVPTAGDEITELIVQALMVDFMTAEQIKRNLAQGGKIKYKDILGIEYTTTSEEILAIIDPAVEKLAEEISHNILELNGQVAPKSVMCVGGGAQVPTLVNRIARKLGLAEQRVVLRNRSHVKILDGLKKKELAGPEGVTVVGIAAVASKRIGQNFINITVNGQVFCLFNTANMNVIKALGFLEFDPGDLLGHNGKDLRFTLNGKPHIVYGEMRQPAVIKVNGEIANLQTTVKDGDVIEVTRAVNGKDATAKVADFLPAQVSGAAQVVCILNGQPAGPDQPIADGDVLEITWPGEPESVISEKIVNQVTRESKAAQDNAININVNGQAIIMKGKQEYILVDIFNYIDIDVTKYSGMVQITRNGEPCEYTDIIQDGDHIEISI